MSSTIATLAGNTGLGSERQIIWAVNSARWWAFGYTGTGTLATWYSSDGVTWTAGATHTLSNNHSSEGRNLAVAYKNISSVDVVHIALPWAVPNTIAINVIRATISGATLTFHSVETAASSGSTDSDALLWSSSGFEVASDNRVHLLNGWASPGNGNYNVIRSTADGGSAEQMTPVTWATTGIEPVTAETRSGYLISTGSGHIGAIGDNGASASGLTGLDWFTWGGSSWTGANGNAAVTGTITSIDKNDWGAVAASAIDIHVVYRNASGGLVHRRYNGSSWSGGQSIPTQTSLAGGGVALMSDGSNVWLCVIDTDSANTVRFIRWSPASVNGIADTWDNTWQSAESTTQTRTWIGCARDVQSQTGLIYWSEGSSFVAVAVVADPPADPAGAWIQSNQGSTGTTALTFPVTFTTQNVVVGNRIVVAVAAWNGTATTVTSVTDTGLNTYSKDKDAVESDGTHVSIWSAPITGGGGTKPTVTAHASATTNEWAMWVHEYSGLLGGTAGYLDGTNSFITSTASSPITSGASAPVPGAASEIAFGFYGDGGNNITTIGVSAGWTQRGTSIQGTSSTAQGACSDQFTVAGVGSNASFTLSSGGSPAAVLVVVYKLAASAIGLTGTDASLSPLTLPGSPYAQMLWAQPAVLATQPAVTLVWIPVAGGRRRAYVVSRRQRLALPAAGPIPGQDVPTLTVRPRTRVVASGRRHPVDIPWFQAVAAPPGFVPQPPRRRAPTAWGRRVRVAASGPGAIDVPPAPSINRARIRFFLRRSRKAAEPTWFQAPLPPVVGELWRRRRIAFDWLARRPSPASVQTPQLPIDGPQQGQRLRSKLFVPRRPRRPAEPTWFQAPLPPIVGELWRHRRIVFDWLVRRPSPASVQAPEMPTDVLVQIQRARLRALVLRRLRAVQQPFQLPVANPPIVDLVRRRILQRFWTKPPKGRFIEPPWGQATATPNPPIVDLVRRRILQRFWVKPPKGRRFEPGWGQATAAPNPPIVLSQLRRLRSWSWLRPRRAVVVPDAQYATTQAVRGRVWWPLRRQRQAMSIGAQADVLAPQQPRRRSWWASRRLRTVAPGVGQGDLPPTQIRARRFALLPRRAQAVLPPFALAIAPAFVDWVRRRVQQRMWPRQPRARRFEPGWGQAVNPVPIQAIALVIVTRSMSALTVTRDLAAIVVTRSMGLAVRTRDMALRIITRSGSSRTNTRG